MIYKGLADWPKSFGDYAELRFQENTASRISMLNGDLIANVKGGQSGFSVRTFKDGVWGFASSPRPGSLELDKGVIEETGKKAAENARFLASKKPAGILLKGQLPSRPGISNKSFVSQKPKKSQRDLIEFLRSLDSYCQKHYKGLSSRTISLSCLDMEKTLATSDGADAYSFTPRTILMVSFTVEEKGEPIDLYEVYGGLGQFEDVFAEPEHVFSKLDILADNLARKSKGVYPKAGIHDVILDSDLAGILAHEAIGHTVEADLVMGGSVAAHAMDREVASPLVSLVDFAHTAMGESCPVPVWTDDEGVEAADAVIIDKGIMKSWMHNKESAAHFGMLPTGNARAYSFQDEPLIRMRNTAILPGSSKLEDMIAGIDKGYYFLRSSNGQADSTSEFMFGIVLGFEIKSGKIGDALRDTTISGVAFDMLKTVSAVSDDMSWSNGGMCGKKQSIPVGMGGPAIRCKLNVGGRN